MLGHEGLQEIIENVSATIGTIVGFSTPNFIAYYISKDWNEFGNAAGALFLPVSLSLAGLGLVAGGLIGEEVYHSIQRRRDYIRYKKEQNNLIK